MNEHDFCSVTGQGTGSQFLEYPLSYNKFEKNDNACKYS